MPPAPDRGTPQRSDPAHAAVGARVRDIRLRDQLDHDSIAAASGIGVDKLHQIEAGQADIEFLELINLAHALRTDPGVLVGGVTL